MDKTKIKKFAIDARRQLIDEITLKMNLLGITKDGIQEPTNATNDIQFLVILALLAMIFNVAKS